MIKKMKDFIHSGVRPEHKDETNRRIMVVNLFAAVGVAVTLLLGLRALAGNELVLALILFTASTLFFISQRIQIKFESSMGRFISVSILITCLMVLVLALLVTGGADNTGPLWIYLVAPVTMFFAGFVRGVLALIAFVILCTLLFFVFDESLLLTTYSYTFKTRLLYSFLTVSFLSAFYEYSRERSYRTTLHLSEQFERMAHHDHLTQLMNRRGVQAILEREYARTQRTQRRFSVAIGDIDHFKRINDTLGHEKGDDVLVAISSLFKKRIRHQDVLARWGGEEFMFVFPETKAKDARQVLESLRETLSKSPLKINDAELWVTCSFGLCEIHESIAISDAIREADKALYEAKESGRNKVVLKTDE